MRRVKALKRGRAVSVLLAGGIGYLLGGWHANTFHSTDLSPSQSVALRFPEDLQDTASDASRAGPTTAPTAVVLGDQQPGLLNPTPMVPQAAAQAVPEAAAAAPITNTAPPQRPVPGAQPASQAKPAAAPNHHRADRPGSALNDAQIASIKQRLHLTPDQEAMWPAVEAALRNVAYARAREAQRHGAPASATQLASADPDSIEVQGLKSAAIPLLMSFSAEQKNEVRSLAHVMGLDNVASQL
jgi:hypothetical protein